MQPHLYLICFWGIHIHCRQWTSYKYALEVEELRRWWASKTSRSGPPPATASQSAPQAEVPEVPEVPGVPEAETGRHAGTPPSSQSVTIPEAMPSSPAVTVPEPSEGSEVDPNEVTIPEEIPTPVRRSKRARKQKEST